MSAENNCCFNCKHFEPFNDFDKKRLTAILMQKGFAPPEMKGFCNISAESNTFVLWKGELVPVHGNPPPSFKTS